jgi:hypothetical protein
MAITETKRLNWRRAPDGRLSLHLDRRTSTILQATPDDTYPYLWRLRFPDGSWSDLGNISRVKEAGLGLGLDILNAPDTGEAIAALPVSSITHSSLAA